MFKRILVPTDGSELSLRAIDGAIQLAKLAGSHLVAVTVAEPFSYTSVSELQPESMDDYERRVELMGRQRLSVVEQRANAAGVSVQISLLRSYSAHEAIIEAVDKLKCDAIVMASHGRRGLKAVLLGSETQKVLTHSTVPVLVYR